MAAASARPQPPVLPFRLSLSAFAFTSSRFDVHFDGMVRAGPIQSVSGLELVYAEASAGRSGAAATRREPARLNRAPNITISRFYGLDNYFYKWMENCEPGNVVDKRTGSIYLLHRSGMPLGAWEIDGCFPIKWEVSALGAQENDPMTETITLATEKIKNVTSGMMP